MSDANRFDRPSAIAASIAVAVVGWAVFMGLPIMVGALVTVNFLELHSLEIISDYWGVSGIFVTFIIINLVILTAWPFLPRGKRGDQHAHTRSEAEFAVATGHTADEEHPLTGQFNLPLLGALCLLAIACFYVMVGSFWAYIERMGVTAGFEDNFVAAALSITTLLSVLGCYIAYGISKRQGQSKPLLIAPVGIPILLVWLGVHTVAFTFVAVLLVYQLLWNGVDIFQLGTISNIDHSGRYIALVPAAQGLGQTVGPSLAGFFVGLGFGYGAVMNLCATAAACTSLIYAFVYWNLRRNAPDLADAK